MELEEIKKRIREEILTQQFPDLINIDPEIITGHSESRLRHLRRSRGSLVTEREINAIPLEHQFIFKQQESEDQPFDKTIVIVTDNDGELQYIIESK
ncbi:hypothetical protein RIVM261_025950 [Rivularia sp. IAM M-261]|nr:hypothetical protein NIES2101_02975 [Calothrix sp. HK-06]GJD17639.1 hypothetical protein RIVM261_025950 [Rivularia sp. IAM M-261]